MSQLHPCLAAVAALGLFLAGCGGSGNTGGTTSTGAGGHTSSGTGGSGGASSSSSSSSSSSTSASSSSGGGTGGSGGASSSSSSSSGGGTGGTGGNTTSSSSSSGGGTGGAGPTACSLLCHGDTHNYAQTAPPLDTHGQADTSAAGVGAHQSHLTPSTWHATVDCTECHLIPTLLPDPAVPSHLNGVNDLSFGPLAKQGTFDAADLSCTGVYCHGGLPKFPDRTGMISNRTPIWNTVDGSQKACGEACHTTPPGGGHPQSNQCEKCHSAVIASFTAGPNPSATWVDPSLHINGVIDVVANAFTCTTCHGDANNAAPAAPPRDTVGNVMTTSPGVGAHQSHLGPSNWHAVVQCNECHQVPATFGDPAVPTHENGVDDIAWGALAKQGTFDTATVTCAGVYCHGGMGKYPDVAGSASNRTPHWTTVDGSQKACGNACHTTPPGGGHPASNKCEACHGQVITSFSPGPNPTAVWANPALHVDGKVEVAPQACTACHGDPSNAAPAAPPSDTLGNTATSTPGVGAHQSHLRPANWHGPVACTECHKVPASFGDPAVPTHANGTDDLSWGPLAQAGTFDGTTYTCAGTYCHGGIAVFPDAVGQTAIRAPKWTTVNGSQEACGKACHTTPPGGGHPQNNGCPTCHSMVIASFTPGANPTATWVDPSLHINGEINVIGLTCTTCHGDPNRAANKPAPPLGTHGETATTSPAVGAHQEHLTVGATWHRDMQCNDCHVVPSSTLHSNGTVDVAWGAGQLASTDGATPSIDFATVTCSGVYCHGATLAGPKAGGSVSRSPVWTTVGGVYDACGSTCHTNPPGGSHTGFGDCAVCHSQVVGAFNQSNNATTWADRTLHIDGVVESNDYHDKIGWTSPKGTTEHHGSAFFLGNGQRDEHNRLCTECHGANLDGGPGTVGVGCDTCHSTWRSCTFCHGTAPSQANPPLAVLGDTSPNSLGVGDHVAHLITQGFACTSCHAVPPAGNVAHAAQYVPSTGLATAGHHGDVSFAGATGAALATVWNVNATQGTPISARGTCTLGCHSNGRGGAPLVVPYWAGGAWTPGCGNCHGVAGDTTGRPNTGEHRNGTSKHSNLSCGTCHPAVPGTGHLNGTVEIKNPLGSGTKTMTPTKSSPLCGGNRISCTGTCHGQECW